VHEHGPGQYTIDHIEDAWRCQGNSRRTFG
jgi:hypothetical protein